MAGQLLIQEIKVELIYRQEGQVLMDINLIFTLVEDHAI